MAISAYVGLPGSGKSYSIFEYVVIPALKKGHDVWTNIPFNLDLLIADFGHAPTHFDAQDIIDNERWFSEVLPKGVICIIDEAWRLWPAGLKANNAVLSHVEFFAEHRHLVGENGRSTEIILATQDLSQLATFARNLINKTYRTVKLDAVGASKKFRVDIYQGPATGPNPPVRNRLDQRFGKYKPEIYQYYKSQTKSDIDEIGDESGSDSRFNLLSGNWIKYSLITIALGGFFIYWAFGEVSAGFGVIDENTVVEFKPVDTVSRTVTGTAPNTALKPLPAKKKRRFDLFDNFKAAITYNNGQGRNIDYRFKFTDDERNFTVSSEDLVAMGYNLRPFNQCLAFAEINGIKHVITCKSPKPSMFSVPVPQTDHNEA